MKILELRGYTVPMFGNEHVQPYGKLVVSDDRGRVVTAKIMEDKDGNQYIGVNKKRYYIRNAGTLYNPRFVFVGGIEDAADKLSKAGYRYEVQNESSLRVFFKDDTDEYTQISMCDEDREGFYMISGKVQNLSDWIKGE